MKKNDTLDFICDSVKTQIMSRAIFPGNRIVEDDLAKEFGVSRAMIRNVMLKLHSEGFVEIIPNKGTIVTKPTHQKILEVYHTRLHLELGVAVLAVQNITEEAIARLEKNYAAQQELKKAYSITTYAELNRAFHWELVLAANNEFYQKYLNEIYNVVHIFMLFYDDATDNTRSLQNHRLLLDALKERDLRKIEDAIRLDNANGMYGLKDIKGWDI